MEAAGIALAIPPLIQLIWHLIHHIQNVSETVCSQYLGLIGVQVAGIKEQTIINLQHISRDLEGVVTLLNEYGVELATSPVAETIALYKQ